MTVLFQGAGTRWPGELAKADRPVHALFETVLDCVAGVSPGCADVFDARQEVEKSGLALLAESKVPGTSGVPSLQRLVRDGYTVLSF